MVPEPDQTLKFFTGDDERRSDEAIEDGCVFRALFAESLRGQTAQKRGDAFNDGTSQWGHLKESS